MENPGENEFWGEFEHSVDDKGRIVMPQDFRGPLGDEFVVTRGPDRSVWILPKLVWNEIYQRIRPGAVLDRQAAILQRQHGGRAFVKLDPQGRLAVPKHLRDYAEITQSKSAVLVGIGPKIELWSKEAWDRYAWETFTSGSVYSASESIASDANGAA